MNDPCIWHILDENNNVKTVSIDEYTKYWKTGKRFLWQETKEVDGKEYFISTVFLGMEYWDGCFFETMIFDKDMNSNYYLERYRSHDMAEHRHKEIVKNLDRIINGGDEK